MFEHLCTSEIVLGQGNVSSRRDTTISQRVTARYCDWPALRTGLPCQSRHRYTTWCLNDSISQTEFKSVLARNLIAVSHSEVGELRLWHAAMLDFDLTRV